MQVQHGNKPRKYSGYIRGKFEEVKTQYPDKFILLATKSSGVCAFDDDAQQLMRLCDNMAGVYSGGTNWAFCRVLCDVDAVLPRLVGAGNTVVLVNI